MKTIPEAMKAYLETHPFDSGSDECATVLDQLYLAYANSHESDPPEIQTALRNWRNSCTHCHYTTTTLSVVSAAAFAPPTNAKHLSMVCNTVRT